MNKNQIKLIIFLILITGIGAIISFYKSNAPSDKEQATVVIKKNKKISTDKIYINISGGVVNPGIYQVDKQTKIKSVIKMAGGLVENVEVPPQVMNYKLIKSDTIIIPVKIEYSELQSTNRVLTNKDVGNISKFYQKKKENKKQDDLININTATIYELKQLPRIGDKMAKMIIEYRTEHGEFDNKKELMNVPRIGNKTYELLKDKIKIN